VIKLAKNPETEIRNKLKQLIEDYFLLKSTLQKRSGISQVRIPLSIPTYGWEEVYDAVDSMLTTRVTMGEKVREFEKLFTEYIGVEHAIMVNSGSSANLIALSILTNPTINNRIQQGDEIITPAVTWSTTVFPIINVNAVPVFVDIDLETYAIDPDEIRKAITNKTRAIMLVHPLGNPCDMKEIMEIAKEYNLFVIEDCCETLGAEYKGKKVGTFGDISTFSFFFSHHISTIEGGMVITNNEEYAELAKILRAHGWIRDLKNKDEIAKRYKDIDERFLFINIGYNLRPTEIQGAFGIHQIKKLDKFIEVRRENARYWTRKLKKYGDYLILPKERRGTKHVWFGYPITVRPNAPFTRNELMQYLEQRGIETRPVIAGNIAEQPVMKLFKHRIVGDLKNSRNIMRRSFFFGNHHGIGKAERKYVVDCISEFIEQKIKV
jgi:CDP-6-deoxy-D-xylo-4-hexulose-3-dehydrase